MFATAENINAIEFDHVFRITEDGMIEDVSNVWAPNLLDGELDDPKWKFFSYGYTGQYGRLNEPIMHDSEYVGGRLAYDMIYTPGIYAVVASYYSRDEDDELREVEPYVSEGWAVVALKEDV